MPAESDPGAEPQREADGGSPGAQDRPTDGDGGDEAGSGDLRRAQRGLRNLAFAVERDRAAVEKAIEGVRSEVAGLIERVDRVQSDEARDIKRGLRELTDELERDRADFESRVDELRAQLEAAPRADELAALRRDVHEANRSLAALRDSAQRRRRFGRKPRSVRKQEGNTPSRPGG